MLEILNPAAVSRALLLAYDLPPTDERDLTLLLNRCFVEDLADGQVLCREGEDGGCMWFLVEGELRVTRRDFVGVDQELGTLRAPTMVGHMSVVDGARRSATCTALGRARTGALDQRTYDAIVADPGSTGQMLRTLILSSMVQQLGRSTARVAELVEASARARRAPSHAELGEVTGTLDGWTRRR